MNACCANRSSTAADKLSQTTLLKPRIQARFSHLSVHALHRSPLFAAGLVLACPAFALPSSAVTLVQTFNDTNSFTSFVESANTTTETVRASPLNFIVQPFQSSLGTLNSVTIEWSSAGSGSAIVGTSLGGGNISFYAGGSVYVGADSYNGYGCGGGNGAASGVSINASIITSPCGNSQLFTLAGAGTSYGPASIWTTLASLNPYTISLAGSNPVGYISYLNIASGSATMVNSAVVTYDYTPSPAAAAAAPAPLPLMGAAAAWRWSRRLRRRCGQSQDSA